MNSHQRRKLAREKEREARKIEIKLIPNPTLTKEAHPAYQGKLIDALMSEPGKRIVYHSKKPHSKWNQFKCAMGFHCKYCIRFHCEACCKCEEEL